MAIKKRKRKRKLTVNNKEYNWTVESKMKTIDSIDYVNVFVDFPDGSLKKFEICLGDKEYRKKNPRSSSVTPADIRNFVEINERII